MREINQLRFKRKLSSVGRQFLVTYFLFRHVSKGLCITSACSLVSVFLNDWVMP